MKILVVDDDPTNRAVATAMLRRFGYEVVSTNGPVQALEILEGRAPGMEKPLSLSIEAVLSDLKMDNQRSGLDLLLLVKLAIPNIKLVLMSGNYGDLRKEALAAGIQCLDKPLLLEEIGKAFPRLTSPPTS